MKHFGIYAFALLICLFESRAQTIQGASQVSLPSSSPYTIVSQDANSRVWQSESYEAGQNGLIVTNIHSYEELASGLNYLKNGAWTASDEKISVLPNGTGAATNGQHKVYFPGDLSSGQIEMDTPDGKQIFSQPLELSYFDGTNTVVLAELTNSIGVIVGNNQVVYPNAFNGLKADIRYTYTRAGLEQDVILKQQPLTPEFYGLNPGSARLQMVTEFFNSPNSTALNTALPEQGGLALIDQSIGFGKMQMIQGRAFLLGQSATEPGTFVAKSWLSVEGRQFLFEEVPVNAVVEGLTALPLTAMNERPGKSKHLVSQRLVLPKHRIEAKSASKMVVSKGRIPSTGFVLDYQTVNSSATNSLYQGDTTYYISGPVYSYGSNVFEGGTVIKYTNSGAIYINPGIGTPSITFKSSSYLPVVFTSKDDNSVGDTISGSTGSPTNYYGTMLDLAGFSPSSALANFRMCYAANGISLGASSVNIYNAQFVYCYDAFNLGGATVLLRNALLANNATNFVLGAGCSVNAQNSTLNGATCVVVGPSSPESATLALTNSILSNNSNLTNGYVTLSGSYNGFYNSASFGNTINNTSVNPFQTVGAGDYYLANGCAFLNCGTTNIDWSLLNYLSQKTTYPPLILSNIITTSPTTLVPQAQRDNFGLPNLGYHYDPIDYLIDDYWVTNCLLTLSDGIVAACYDDPGFVITDGGSVTSVGSALTPNIVTSYQTVQEEPVSISGTGSGPASTDPVDPYHVSAAPNGQFDFTKFTCLAGGGYHLYDFGTGFSYSNLLVQNCEFWGGANNLGGWTGAEALFDNNVFVRSTVQAQISHSCTILFTNNLFWGASSIYFLDPTESDIFAFDNDFDSCSIHNASTNCANGYNAFLNCTREFIPTNSTSVFSTNGLNYQTSFLGAFYQPTNSPLLHLGSTTANLVGLYHFTTQTNQVIEGTNIVTIGYHYVATDTNGVPLDTNGDGIPDYVEDANGNGLVDSGEIGWNLTNDLGLQVIISQPASGSTIP